MTDQTRRTFIMNSAKITGAVMSTATLAKELMLPQSIEAAHVQFPESHCGNNKKGRHKILVAYASKFGTTGGVAEAVGEVFCREGHTVDTKWVPHVQDIHKYDAVVIGGAIQYDTWMSEATKFVTANQHILHTLPVAYFFTCLVLSKQTDKAERKAKAYAEKLSSLVPHVIPVSVGRFAGVLDYSKMSFFFRQISKVVLSIMAVQEGDYRDWDAIRSWTKGLNGKLTHIRT
jgi:menaquinone-dependent protoporphyrinogen oxidase